MRTRVVGFGYEEERSKQESVSGQVKGFLQGSAQMLGELGRACRGTVQQSLVGVEDSYLVKKLRGPWAVVSGRLEFRNEFFPEDKDPSHAWSVLILVFLLTVTGWIR